MKDVRNRYKVTSLGEIPSEWGIKKFDEVLDFGPQNGLYKHKDFYIGNENYIIQLSNFYDSEKYINWEELDGIQLENSEKELYSLSCGDLIINRVSKAVDGVGKMKIVPQIDTVIVYESNMMRIKINENILNQEFLYYLSESDKFRKSVIKKAKVSNQASLSQSDISELEICIPSKKEQQKIIEILSTWDSAIEKKEQLIEKKKELKKGLMQNLLSGEVRFKEFNDKWSKKTLDKYIIPVVRECDKPSEGYWRLGLRSHGKGTFHEFVEDPTTVSMDKLYEVKSNDLIVNITFAWEHAIAVANADDEGKLVSHRFPTYEFKSNAYPAYFKYYILQQKFKNMLVNISPGGAGRNRVMNKKDFLKLEVLIPSYEEQKRISEVLLEHDKEIELLEKELEIIKRQKKGLMQRLLTGEVRVKV